MIKRIGSQTFFGQNGPSTVDYLLLGLLYLPYKNNFEILPPNEFSDHCPISFSINIETDKSENQHEGEYPSTWGHGIIVSIFKSGDPTDAKHYRRNHCKRPCLHFDFKLICFSFKKSLYICIFCLSILVLL